MTKAEYGSMFTYTIGYPTNKPIAYLMCNQ